MNAENRPEVSVLVTDLDNTLWDWVHLWHASFDALLGVLTDGGLDREDLLTEAHAVHQRHRTSEYSLLLDELPTFAALDHDRSESLREGAISAAQRARSAAQALYPGVLSTLEAIRRARTLVVAYTESMAWPTSQRIRQLQLDGVIDYLYSSPDHDFPDDAPPELLRNHPAEHYQLKRTVHRHVPHGVVKPSVRVLEQILEDVGAPASRTAYVGDSAMKDIAMAQDAGVLDVLAQYGHAQDREEYELLRRVTHWSAEDVERERALLAGPERTASFTLHERFDELLGCFTFQAHGET